MRFVNRNGLMVLGRRARNYAGRILETAIESPSKLVEILNDLSRRLTEVESKVPSPEPMEYEINVGTAGATVTLQHGFGVPIRWYVVSWTNASGGHSLVKSTASTADRLVLSSFVSGRAVIRIEPSQFTIQ